MCQCITTCGAQSMVTPEKDFQTKTVESLWVLLAAVFHSAWNTAAASTVTSAVAVMSSSPWNSSRQENPSGPAGDVVPGVAAAVRPDPRPDRKSTRLNSSHVATSYAVFCLKK